MSIADVDQSGTINFEEWFKFIDKLESEDIEQTSEDDLREIFESIDDDQDGELNIQEFGAAILMLLNKSGVDKDEQ